MKYLLISYGCVLLVTLFAAVTGLIALQQNGVYYGTSFTTILATTRNSELDALCEGASLGDTEGIEDARLTFGILKNTATNTEKGTTTGSEPAIGHAAFGFEGSVARLKKGDPVY